MSSIMRARSALTGRWEGWEVIGGSSLKPKVAEPSMLGIGCPDRHALPLTIHRKRTDRDAHPSRESGFVHRVESGHRNATEFFILHHGRRLPGESRHPAETRV